MVSAPWGQIYHSPLGVNRRTGRYVTFGKKKKPTTEKFGARLGSEGDQMNGGPRSAIGVTVCRLSEDKTRKENQMRVVEQNQNPWACCRAPRLVSSPVRADPSGTFRFDAVSLTDAAPATRLRSRTSARTDTPSFGTKFHHFYV